MLFLWLIGNYASNVEEFEPIIKTIKVASDSWIHWKQIQSFQAVKSWKSHHFKKHNHH